MKKDGLRSEKFLQAWKTCTRQYNKTNTLKTVSKINAIRESETFHREQSKYSRTLVIPDSGDAEIFRYTDHFFPYFKEYVPR